MCSYKNVTNSNERWQWQAWRVPGSDDLLLSMLRPHAYTRHTLEHVYNFPSLGHYFANRKSWDPEKSFWTSSVITSWWAAWDHCRQTRLEENCWVWFLNKRSRSLPPQCLVKNGILGVFAFCLVRHLHIQLLTIEVYTPWRARITTTTFYFLVFNCVVAAGTRKPRTQDF